MCQPRFYCVVQWAGRAGGNAVWAVGLLVACQVHMVGTVLVFGAYTADIAQQ